MSPWRRECPSSESIQDDGTDNELWSDVWRRNSAGEFPLSELGVDGKRAIRLADYARLYEVALDRPVWSIRRFELQGLMLATETTSNAVRSRHQRQRSPRLDQ